MKFPYVIAQIKLHLVDLNTYKSTPYVIYNTFA